MTQQANPFAPQTGQDVTGQPAVAVEVQQPQQFQQPQAQQFTQAETVILQPAEGAPPAQQVFVQQPQQAPVQQPQQQFVQQPQQPIQQQQPAAPQQFVQQPQVQVMQPAVIPQGAPPAPTMPFVQNEGVMDISFDSDVKINNLEKIPKLRKDETIRIGFPLFDANGSPMIKMSYYFFDNIGKWGCLAPKDPEVLKKVVAKMGEPKIRFATIVVLYQTDQYGNVAPGFRYSLNAFRFSTDKFPVLKSLHREWGLQNHDILMTCTEAEFQKVSMNPARESLWRTLPDAQQIWEKAQAAYDQFLPKLMGSPMTDQDILIKLGYLQAPQAAQAQLPVNPFGQPAQQFAGQVGVGQPVGGDFAHLVAGATQQHPQ